MERCPTALHLDRSMILLYSSLNNAGLNICIVRTQGLCLDIRLYQQSSAPRFLPLQQIQWPQAQPHHLDDVVSE